MRSHTRLAYFILSILLAAPTLSADSRVPVRIALTSVAVSSEPTYVPAWKEYLEEKIERTVEFRFPNSCRKVTSLLRKGLIDIAWIDGYCYVKYMGAGYMELMTVPVYRGEPHHRSYIVVHRDSGLTDISDLKGRVFAFSDPESNTGYAYPLTLLPKRQGEPESYFRRSFFTFNHASTVQAIAHQVADGGAVDSYVWEYLASVSPEVTRKTRIIDSSPKFGFSPLILRTGVPGGMAEGIRKAFESMHREPEGKHILVELKLDEFRQFSPDLFRSTRQILIKLQTRSAWSEVVVND